MGESRSDHSVAPKSPQLILFCSGLFNFAAESNSGNSNSYSSGFQVAQQLVQVAIGLTVGLFLSAAVTREFARGLSWRCLRLT